MRRPPEYSVWVSGSNGWEDYDYRSATLTIAVQHAIETGQRWEVRCGNDILASGVPASVFEPPPPTLVVVEKRVWALKASDGSGYYSHDTGDVSHFAKAAEFHSAESAAEWAEKHGYEVVI